VLWLRRPQWIEPTAVGDDAAHEAIVERAPTEPQDRSPGTERLGLEVRIGEGVVAAFERGRRLPKERVPGGEVLVEQVTSFVEGHSKGLVLGSMPTHRRLDDQAALRQEIERGQLLRKQQRVMQRRDDRAGDQPKSGCYRGDR